jgi:hypothetical protein
MQGISLCTDTGDSSGSLSQSETFQPSTRRNTSPSLPAIPVAAAPMARFCGEIILPSTPPELLAAVSSTGWTPAALAAVTCREPKTASAEV